MLFLQISLSKVDLLRNCFSESVCQSFVSSQLGPVTIWASGASVLLDLSKVSLLHISWELTYGSSETVLESGGHGWALRYGNGKLEVSELENEGGNWESSLGNVRDISLGDDTSETSAESLSINASSNEETIGVRLEEGDGSSEGKSSTLKVLADNFVVVVLSDGLVDFVVEAVELLVLLKGNKIDDGEDVIDELVDVVKMEGAEVSHLDLIGDWSKFGASTETEFSINWGNSDGGESSKNSWEFLH